MKRVTRNNLLKLVDLEKKYLEDKSNKQILKIINEFINNVINKDKRYYSKLQSYNFDEETIRYLL